MEEKHSWKKAGGDAPLDDIFASGRRIWSPWRSVGVQGGHVPFGRSLSQVTRSYYYLVERLQRQLVHLCLQYFFLQLKDVLPEKNACFLSLYLLLVWLMKLLDMLEEKCSSTLFLGSSAIAAVSSVVPAFAGQESWVTDGAVGSSTSFPQTELSSEAIRPQIDQNSQLSKVENRMELEEL